jgi:hypothetical protein
MQRMLREVRQALSGLGGPVADASWQARALELEPSLARDSTLRTVEAPLLESRFATRPLATLPSRFAAFLDGAQWSQVAAFVGGVPIVVATVAAVIRERVQRRLRTWENGFDSLEQVYVPVPLLPPEVKQKLAAADLEPRNTLDTWDGSPMHPNLLLMRAVHAVQEDREQLEQELAERWCSSREEPLLVDGGLPQGLSCKPGCNCVGAVKSHNTLYASGTLLEEVLALPVGARSAALMVEHHWGPPCVSWYLRLRPAAADDPLRGLLRVEAILEPGPSLTKEVDAISGWLLSERAPLALPDPRWPVLLYGIRDCEEWLRARRTRS